MTATISSASVLKSLMRPAALPTPAQEQNEEHIAHMTEAIKNSDNLDQFMGHIDQLQKNKAQNDQSQQIDQSSNFASPIKRTAYSASFRSPTSALRSPTSNSKVFDAFQYFDSSDEDECTFHPKINNNASRNSKNVHPSLSVNEYLYGDAFERKTKHQERKDLHHSNIHQKMKSSKTAKKSANIVLQKLTNALKNIVTEAEKQDSDGRICFEGLGTILHQLGVFQNLEFVAPEAKGERSSVAINQTRVKPERLAKEITFHESFWKILTSTSGEENKPVKSEIVLSFLLVLVEEKIPISDAADSLTAYMDSVLQQANLPVFAELATQNNLWTMKDLILEFRRLFDDKTSFMNIYSASGLLQAKNTAQLEQRYTHNFRPQTNPRSKALDAMHLNRTLSPKLASIDPNWEANTEDQRHHRLNKYHKYLANKKHLKLEERIQDEISQCTFSPKVKIYQKPQGKAHQNNRISTPSNKNSYFHHTQSNTVSGTARHHALYEVAKTYRANVQQKAYTIKKKEELNEASHCSFEPKLNRYYETSPVRNQHFYEKVPNGFKKNVERVVRGTVEKKQKQAAIEKIPRGEDYHKNKNADFKPPKMLERPKTQKEEVLVYVDVSIGPGKTGRIGIHKNDNAKALAINFARTYSLNATMRDSLEGLLQSYIDSYFAQANANGKADAESNENNHEEDEEIEGVDEAHEDEEEEH